jgi:hypothetical protein
MFLATDKWDKHRLEFGKGVKILAFPHPSSSVFICGKFYFERYDPGSESNHP